MTDIALDHGKAPPSGRPHLDHKFDYRAALLFVVILVLGLGYTAWSLFSDVQDTGAPVTAYMPFVLLGVALVIALGFEFVNGFHDTANAVATVIYTHSLSAPLAVVWSGFFNFLGVMVSSGAVAFGIISLLPVELILQVGSAAGFAMVFALLFAAIIWNLGTWYLGLPASSSHTLIGSIIGVGVANSLIRGGDGTSGVDWGQAATIGEALLLSPLIGFCVSAALLLAMKAVIRNPDLYREPKGNQPPPWWIRGLLVLTCTGVSFAHGSNDGQKGMGLIMLILIGTIPTAYALNRAMPESEVVSFHAVAQQAAAQLSAAVPGVTVPQDQARGELTRYVKERSAKPETVAALATLSTDMANAVGSYGNMKKIPFEAVSNIRNDMYLASETLRFLPKQTAVKLDADTVKTLGSYKKMLDDSTKFIPTWVKVAVAIALGLGTMIGWKRIVVTVGEKIGKSHLTYGQGASAELVTAVTIFSADTLGLPVSTTHILSSGVAGAMAANKSGLQWSTVRNLILAWVMTLPAAMAISAALYALFYGLFV